MRNPEQRRMERREARLDAAKRGLESLFASLRSNKRALSLLVPAIAVGISNPVEASTDMEPEKDRI